MLQTPSVVRIVGTLEAEPILTEEIVVLSVSVVD